MLAFESSSFISMPNPPSPAPKQASEDVSSSWVPFDMSTDSARVAVIGAGPAGLAAIKSLQEEGFQVTGFERRPDVGGLWAFSDVPNYTSATKDTRYQMSKFISCFTDFPFPDDFPRFPMAEDMASYYQSYAQHFGLMDRIRFGAVVRSVRRSSDDTAWLLDVEGEAEPLSFDKVLVAAGTETEPKPLPEFEGRELFEGKVMHSQAYKRPEDFQGLNVVVVGQGNTACDCAVELASHARGVYLAHRRRAVVIPRNVDGQRYDRSLTWRMARISVWLQAHMPAVHRRLMCLQLSGVARKAWGGSRAGEDALLGVTPALATNIASLVVNDDLVPLLRGGGITATRALKRFVGPRELEMEDGRVVRDVDAVIVCTGYTSSLGVLAPGVLEYDDDDDDDDGDESTPCSDEEDYAIGAKQAHPAPRVPRLYRNIFPPRWADSLACLNYLVLIHAAVQREVAGMAVAQVWAGKTALPPRAEMEAQADAQARGYRVARRRRRPQIAQPEGLVVDPHSWLRWVDEAAGSGVYASLGWTWRGLLFFAREPRLWLLAAWGVNSPHIYRLFETGKRRAWDGAREAILRVNEQSAADARLGAAGAHATAAPS
ncbi:hypothetical protein RB597_008940 [Gaeumannomyces tritici]